MRATIRPYSDCMALASGSLQSEPLPDPADSLGAEDDGLDEELPGTTETARWTNDAFSCLSSGSARKRLENSSIRTSPWQRSSRPQWQMRILPLSIERPSSKESSSRSMLRKASTA